MNCYICGCSIHSLHNIRIDAAGMRHSGCEPPAKQEKPPLGLMPHHCWVYRRISEIMRAIIRYEDAGMPVPLEWCDELRAHLVASNRKADPAAVVGGSASSELMDAKPSTGAKK